MLMVMSEISKVVGMPSRSGGTIERGGPGCLNRFSALIGGASAGLGRHAEWQQVEVGLIRRLAVKARMRSATIVEVEITADRSAGIGYTVVGSQIDLLVFDAAPQPLDKDVVAPGPFAVHADRNAVVGECIGEGRARELRALVGIEDVRLR